MTTGEGTWDELSKEEALRRIERMLTPKSTVPDAGPEASAHYVPAYGDLTVLNTSRLVLDSVGPALLTDIVADSLDLLETSATVCEMNGDYALRVFSSGWCRFLDESSRERCRTPDNREALRSGQWLCHESCWNGACRRAIETGKPVDATCCGGIRLFSAPICAGKGVVGTVSVGYGDPPRDPAKLHELAAAYGVSVEDLRERAQSCEARPAFIIESAKNRLLSSARLIGEIVNRKRAEETLRESESLLRAVLDNTPFELWVRDRDGRCIMQNTALERRWGSLLGQRPEDARVSRAVLETWQATNRRALAGEVVDGEWEYTLAREKRSYHTILAPVRVGEEIRGILGFNMDITERKRTREALRETNEALQGLIQASPVAIVVHDPEGKVKLWNPAAERMFGWSEEEVLGRFLPYVSEENLEEHLALRERVLRGQPLTGTEVSRRRKDGSAIHISVSTSPLCDAGGNITAIMSAIVDITERKRAEEERKKLEAQMREVQKLESLGILAGGIAHDFNNLLMAILGNADLALLSLSPASPVRENVEEIVRASQRASDLCRQMLAYSGKGRFVVDRYDLSEIVREMAQMLDVSVSKKASLRYLFAEGLPPVEVDATQMRQIIMNLITNASEALGDQSGVITIATGMMECDRAYLSESYLDDRLAEGWYVFLEVSDTGCGMDAETLSRIFDPFFTTKFTGRGLGLAAVLGIVRGHKGAIKVYSEQGKGTVFKILLPAAEWKKGNRLAPAERYAFPQGGSTILLVDDDLYVRDVGSKMLVLLGFKVLTAADGREGVDVFRAHRGEIDCVILDLTMPEMGGEETFRELRRIRSDVRVILSSGYNEQDVVQRFAGKGLAGFVQKPYTVGKLGEILNLVLG